MTSNDFRAELMKIMPGYSWTVHKSLKSRLPAEIRNDLPDVLTATGTQSSGSNRLSTLEVTRRADGGQVTYTAKSAGYGTKARWLHKSTCGTLARALRGLQDHYEAMSRTYRSHASALELGRKEEGDTSPAKKDGAA